MTKFIHDGNCAVNTALIATAEYNHQKYETKIKFKSGDIEYWIGNYEKQLPDMDSTIIPAHSGYYRVDWLTELHEGMVEFRVIPIIAWKIDVLNSVVPVVAGGYFENAYDTSNVRFSVVLPNGNVRIDWDDDWGVQSDLDTALTYIKDVKIPEIAALKKQIAEYRKKATEVEKAKVGEGA